MELPRSAGILLHPTSLPSGKLDRDAYRFVDWLAAAGQSWWQVLPLGPPDEFRSPYRSPSAFAASPRLLARPGARVTAGEVEDFVARHPFWTGGWAQFAGAEALADEVRSPYRSPSAFAASPQLLARPGARVTAGEVEDFVARHPFWTGGWAQFAGAEALADEVRFEREWGALRSYAAERGVRLIGDVPIYVSDGGADHDCWPELFAHGEVAGAPPDALSATGQRWGNPLYDWPIHRATGFHWWRERFRRTFELVDLCRIDHFRGFVSYWAIPARNSTAKSGRWRPGPGAELFRAVEHELGGLPLIAEDLGHITPPVYKLRDELGLPGTVVLIWAFRRRKRNPHDPANYRRNSVAYTSTHDTDPAAGWFAGLTPRQRAATGLDPREPSWGLIELAYSSRAALAIVPAQDVLGLGSEARMNRPGVTNGNWSWQLERGALTPALAKRLRSLAQQAGRAT